MNLEERIFAVVAQNIEKRLAITMESNLIEDLGVDSFSKLMIIAGLEDEFSISIDETEFNDVITVADIVAKMREAF
ncbi:MAG: acyl carrier protein [Bacillota bacterium]|jgi:acyl carrier protein